MELEAKFRNCGLESKKYVFNRDINSLLAMIDEIIEKKHNGAGIVYHAIAEMAGDEKILDDPVRFKQMQ